MRGTSYAAEKDDLLLRLRKMEGQVRGVQQMVTTDRYCLDIVQQINAITAAAREVELIVLEAHLSGCIAAAVTEQDGAAALKEMTQVLRKTLRP